MISKEFSEKIKGKRIYLEKHKLNSASLMYSVIKQNRDYLAEFLPWVQYTNSISDSEFFIKTTHNLWQINSAFEYAIYLHDNKQYIGNIGAINVSFENESSEIGYWIDSRYSGNGYMTEAVKVLEKYLFKNGFIRLEIKCDPDNLKSKNIALKRKHQLDGCLRSNYIINDTRRDTLIFSKLNTD